MAKRNFDNWLNTFKDSIATWGYYTDFKKVFKEVEKKKVELNILNALIGSKTIEKDFKEIVKKYPQVLSCIPILIAKREEEKIIIKDIKSDYQFDFKKPNYSVDEYSLFMKKNGIFDLLQNHLINNIYDYVTGVEVGLDSNARKNRTGTAMENLVENYFIDAGFELNKNLFSQMKVSEIKHKWGINLSKIDNKKKAEKRFDFVVKTSKKLYVVETNFYSGQGSKLNETARSYEEIAMEISKMKDVEFIWITDGDGWKKASNNLKETFEVMEHLYNIKDLDSGILKKIIK